MHPAFSEWLKRTGKDEWVSAIEDVEAAFVADLMSTIALPLGESTPPVFLEIAADRAEALFMLCISEAGSKRGGLRTARYLASRPELIRRVQEEFPALQDPDGRENAATVLARAMRLQREMRYGKKKKRRRPRDADG